MTLLLLGISFVAGFVSALVGAYLLLWFYAKKQEEVDPWGTE